MATVHTRKARVQRPIQPDALRRYLNTVAAANYCGVSPALLRKYRLRKPGDPGEVGPAFIRLSPTLLVYAISELDRWIDGHRTPSQSQAA